MTNTTQQTSSPHQAAMPTPTTTPKSTNRTKIAAEEFDTELSANEDGGGGCESIAAVNGAPAAPRPVLMDITARGNTAILNVQGLAYGGAFRPHPTDQGNWFMPNNVGIMPDNLGFMPDDLGAFWAPMHTPSP